MITFFKAQITSLLASAVDFLTTYLFVRLCRSWYVSASLTGAICGGLVSFVIAKKWTFAESDQPTGIQFRRFVLVWLGNAGLNVTGLFVATHFLGIHYLVAKTAVSILVGISYNYIFQKDFVFTMS